MTDEGKKSIAMKYFIIVHVNTLSNSKRLWEMQYLAIRENYFSTYIVK